MAIVIEDGSGLPSAESYISVADADAYHAARGATAWAALTETAKEQALRLATDYMGQVYRRRWGGDRRTVTQRLDWPRTDCPYPDAPGGYGSWPSMYPDDQVPAEVKEACAMLALKASAQELAPDVGRVVLSESVAGAISRTYAPGAPPYVRFRAVDNLLSPLLSGLGTSSITLSRS